MILKETTAVYFENHTKHKNTLFWKNAEFQYIKTADTYSNHWDL
jgi:hypothetical protein